MKIIISGQWMKVVEEMIPAGDCRVRFHQRFGYYSEERKAKIEIADWPKDSVKKLFDFLGKEAAKGDRSAQMSQRVVQTWMELQDNPDGQAVAKLENVDSAMARYIGTSEHRWVFEQLPDENLVPWFVDSIKYEERTKFSSAHVDVYLSALNTGTARKRDRDGEGRSFSILACEIQKKTMSQILENKGFYLETPDRVKSYQKEVDRFLNYHEQDGFQMSVTGKCKSSDSWHGYKFRNVEKAGRPAKMVVDPGEEENKDVSAVECKFWVDKPEEHLWILPIHPILDMFDLDEHCDYRVHINNAVPYVYDKKVGDKLVLPADVKDFIETLVEHSKNHFVDIVGSKEGGTILLLEGPAGTGKTLTAEVYSEVMERPLYRVQSSQLGTSAQGLEKELQTVLGRSERWGAILLIDEADVYIHERGSDIEQNAIVGVFLRVLEYYRGVLFMTTNRGTLVDDAIISRLTARFRYKNPTADEQEQLWRVLASQNKIDLPESEIKVIVKSMRNLSGRDIKNLLKLAYVASLKKGSGKVSAETIKYVSRFKQSDDEK